MSSPVWFKDPTILLRNDKIKDVWPNKNMTPEEKLNAITRLVIFMVVIGFIITFRFNILIIGLVTLGLVNLLYILHIILTSFIFSISKPEPIL